MKTLNEKELCLILGGNKSGSETTDGDHWDPEHCDPDYPGDGCMPIKNPWG